jgi:hypothetical protein
MSGLNSPRNHRKFSSKAKASQSLKTYMTGFELSEEYLESSFNLGRCLCICQEDMVERSAKIMLIREIYHQSGSLDPICGWQTLNRIDSTWEPPYWTPDYTLGQEAAPAPLVPVDRRPSIYAASGYDHRSKFQLPAESTPPDWKQDARDLH